MVDKKTRERNALIMSCTVPIHLSQKRYTVIISATFNNELRFAQKSRRGAGKGGTDSCCIIHLVLARQTNLPIFPFQTWYAKTPLGKKRAKAAAGDDEGDKKGKKGGKKGGKKKKK